jgi:N6-adenosine-specific RNA methylase IME4
MYCPTTEFLLLGRRGKMPVGKIRRDSTWWQVKRTGKHSKKPEFFQDMIEGQSDCPRIELFARRERLGWDVWGNEVNDHHKQSKNKTIKKSTILYKRKYVP